METRDIITPILAIALVCVAGVAFLLSVRSSNPPEPTPVQYGSAADNKLDSVTPTTIYVKNSSTAIVSTSTGSRRYLEIFNQSGATTTPQTLFCSLNDAPATVAGSSFQIAASSSKIFTLDNDYMGAIRCITQASTAFTTVTEQN